MRDFSSCFLRCAILLLTILPKKRPCSFVFVFFGNAPTFPALLQFSLNTTVIGLISYLRPGSGSEVVCVCARVCGMGGGVTGKGDPAHSRQSTCLGGNRPTVWTSAPATILPFKDCL